MGNWLKSIWRGESKNRLSMLKYAAPNGDDWERLVEELGKTQQEVLNLAATGGELYVTDVEPQDSSNETVTSKIFIDTAGETVLQSFITSTLDIKITITSTFPMCKIGETEIELDEVNEGGYRKEVNYTLDEEETEFTVTLILPNSTEGISYSCSYSYVPGPTILTLVFTGGYPGSQTEVKEGDTFQIIGTTNSSCNAVRILDYGACEYEITTFPLTNSFIVTATIKATGYTTTLFTAKLQARNSSGAFGPEKETDNGVYCNDTYPTFIDNGFTNTDNPGAVAFKGTESGIQNTKVENYDSVVYTSDEFSITNSTTYEQEKTITCLNPGTYNDNETNFTITVNRMANDATAVFEKTIEVADTAPLLTVTQPYSRLRSEDTYTITITSDQNLLAAPDINNVVSGTWQGAGFEADPPDQLKIWTRDILIEHADARGSSAWTQVTPAQNRAEINANITGNQVVGGFKPITVTFDHTPEWTHEIISTLAAISCLPSNPEKLIVKDNAEHDLDYQASKADGNYKFTITDAGGNLSDTGNYLYWCDFDAIAANTQGTAFLIIEETV